MEWRKTMELQDGIDSSMGQFRMSLDEQQPFQRPVSLLDIASDIARMQLQLLERFDDIEYQLELIAARVEQPWYSRLGEWIRDRWDDVRTQLARIRRH